MGRGAPADPVTVSSSQGGEERRQPVQSSARLRTHARCPVPRTPSEPGTDRVTPPTKAGHLPSSPASIFPVRPPTGRGVAPTGAARRGDGKPRGPSRVRRKRGGRHLSVRRRGGKGQAQKRGGAGLRLAAHRLDPATERGAVLQTT